MTDLLHFIANVLDPIGIVVGLVIAVPVFGSWGILLGQQRRKKLWLREISQSPGQRPAILIVDLLQQKAVRTQVELWRQQDDALKTVPADRIFHISRDARLTASDMPALVSDIRAAIAKMMSAGTDKVHLIYAGPVGPAVILGGELANGRTVIIYQHQPDGYQNWGPLQHD